MGEVARPTAEIDRNRARKAMERYGLTGEAIVWRGEIQSPSITIEKR